MRKGNVEVEVEPLPLIVNQMQTVQALHMEIIEETNAKTICKFKRKRMLEMMGDSMTRMEERNDAAVEVSIDFVAGTTEVRIETLGKKIDTNDLGGILSMTSGAEVEAIAAVVIEVQGIQTEIEGIVKRNAMKEEIVPEENARGLAGVGVEVWTVLDIVRAVLAVRALRPVGTGIGGRGEVGTLGEKAKKGNIAIVIEIDERNGTGILLDDALLVRVRLRFLERKKFGTSIAPGA